MRYCLVVDGKLIDLNDHDIYMLEEDDVVTILDGVPSEYVDDVAMEYDKVNRRAIFRKMSSNDG